MSKINWSVRLRNPMFWLTAIPAVISFAYSILSLFDIVPQIAESTVVSAVSTIISALTALGVLVDPTTKGVTDSPRALTYAQPYESTPEGEYTDADE